MTRTKKIVVGAAGIGLLFAATGCYSGDEGAQADGQKKTEEAYEKLEKAVPYPVGELNFSLERENLRKKLLITNQADKVGYVYVMSFGEFIGYYVVEGKVSSNQSQMTTDNLVTRRCTNGDCQQHVVNAPGDDGSYGTNEDGIFFFTTSGAYVSTNMDYVYLDQPMQVDVPQLTK